MADAALARLKRPRAKSPRGANCSNATAQSSSGLAVISRQNGAQLADALGRRVADDQR
jgi:hypothetical protein